jgi:hypothetical protein
VTESVVVHYRDGQLLKGQTTGFSGEVPTFEVQQLHGGPQAITVEFANLKAVFFVRDFVGNSAYDEVKAFRAGSRQPPGARMEVGLIDGETLVGTVEGYRPSGLGFFLVPADPKSNNLKCFVVSTAVTRASVI